ncbi:MAG TPA: hypothetical protein PKH54_07375 [Myxococcota bacterium]|nr:hypothetical protein [Myxococcota bacterium]
MDRQERMMLADVITEVALSLVGVFDAFNADAEMVDAVSNALRKVFAKYQEAGDSTAKNDATGTLKKLIDEMEASSGRVRG